MKTIPVSLVFASTLLGVWADPEPPAAPAPPAGEARPGLPTGPDQRKAFKRQGAEFWKRADTNGDGFVSKEEFFALERVSRLSEERRNKLFDRLDKDGDGKLSREELEKISPPEGPGGPQHGIFPRLAELDTDKDGRVSFEEFKAAEFVKKLPPDQQEALFKRLDRDGDGYITPKDRPAEPPHEGGRPEGREGRGEGRDENGPNMGLRQILRTLDANGDGAVTFDEFMKAPFAARLGEDAMEKKFEKLDRNGDKKLTLEDLPPKPDGEGEKDKAEKEKPAK